MAVSFEAQKLLYGLSRHSQPRRGLDAELRQRHQRFGFQKLDQLKGRGFGARRQLDDERLSRCLDKIHQRIHGGFELLGRVGVLDEFGQSLAVLPRG